MLSLTQLVLPGSTEQCYRDYIPEPVISSFPFQSAGGERDIYAVWV